MRLRSGGGATPNLLSPLHLVFSLSSLQPVLGPPSLLYVESTQTDPKHEFRLAHPHSDNIAAYLGPFHGSLELGILTRGIILRLVGLGFGIHLQEPPAPPLTRASCLAPFSTDAHFCRHRPFIRTQVCLGYIAVPETCARSRIISRTATHHRASPARKYRAFMTTPPPRHI